MRTPTAWVLAVLGLATVASAAEGPPLTIAHSLVVRTAPRTDAPEVAALLGGVRAHAAPVDGAPGWLRLTGLDGRELGFAWQRHLEPAPARTSLLAGALGGSAAPSEPPAPPAPPPAAAAASAPARTSLLIGALTRGADAPTAPGEPLPAAAPGASPAPAAERPSALSGFLQAGGGGSGGSLGLSSLTDGRLAQAQAAHAEEQRRLAEIAEAERRAAEAERQARAAEDEARRQIEQAERAQQRAEERRQQQASDAILANAVMGAALTIGNAMADNLRASHARMLAENQQRMAEANRRAAQQRLNAARADADRARREAAAAAARARQPAIAPSQQQTARVDYLARAQAQRAAEANFQQQQAALQQAQRAAALALQSPVASLGSTPATGGAGDGVPSTTGIGLGSGSARTPEPEPASTPMASAPSAATVVGLDINYHDVGRGSGTRQIGQLQVSLTIRDVKVNGDKSRICAEFRNPLAGEWKGGYRLTSRYEEQTFARLTVGPGQTTTVCEILPAVKTYYVVLRQDAPPRSRDSSFGVRG